MNADPPPSLDALRAHLAEIDGLMQVQRDPRNHTRKLRRKVVRMVWGTRVAAFIVLALAVGTLVIFLAAPSDFGALCVGLNAWSAVSMIRTEMRCSAALREADAHHAEAVGHLKKTREQLMRMIADRETMQ